MTPSCVYTVVTGGYERLNPQPLACASGLRFICLTDDAALPAAEGWEIRHVPLPLPGDTTRSQRMIKILPHRYLPEFASSLYIDNTVKLRAPPEALFAAAPNAALALCQHSFRPHLHEEFHAVVEQRLDDGARVAEQRTHYQNFAPEILDGPVLWTGLMLRRHDLPELRYAMEIWCAHVLRYSRRDQLSAPMALRQAGLVPHLLPWDNYQSDFHEWPILTGRKENIRVTGEPETDAAKIAELEARLVSMWQGRLAAEAQVKELTAAQEDLVAALEKRWPVRAKKYLARIGKHLTACR